MSKDIDVQVVQGPAKRPTLIIDGLHVAGPDHFNQNRIVEEWTIRGTMADRLRARLRDSDEGVRRLSDGSLPDTAHWTGHYDYAAFIEDGTLVIETGAAKEGAICCNNREELKVIHALLERELYGDDRTREEGEGDRDAG